MISKELLDLMACPFCKADVVLKDNNLVCLNPECGCQYRIEEDIPVMLIDEARRPCPKCGTQRDWLEEESQLACPKCRATLTQQRK
jgi:hypothetical protein